MLCIKLERDVQPSINESKDEAEAEMLLVHDGKYIRAFHGSEARTISGDPNVVFVTGTKKELNEEIKKLGLKSQDIVDANLISVSKEL